MGTNNPSVKLHVIGSQTISGNQTVKGKVFAEDTLDVGLELVYSEEFDNDIFATCPAGKMVIGGGCDCNDNEGVQRPTHFLLSARSNGSTCVLALPALFRASLERIAPGWSEWAAVHRDIRVRGRPGHGKANHSNPSWKIKSKMPFAFRAQNPPDN